MHRDDDIKAADWIAMCAGLESVARHRLANWLAHGMRLTKEQDGVRMDRRDFTELGEYLFLTNAGREERRPI